MALACQAQKRAPEGQKRGPFRCISLGSCVVAVVQWALVLVVIEVGLLPWLLNDEAEKWPILVLVDADVASAGEAPLHMADGLSDDAVQGLALRVTLVRSDLRAVFEKEVEIHFSPSVCSYVQ